MKLHFLGTRGYIESRTERHRMHSALLLSYRKSRVLIDCGEDWARELQLLPRLEAILITHAHPDHAGGLANGAPCPVYATADSWRGMAAYPIGERYLVPPREPFQVGAFGIEAFPVVHSVRFPAVGYRLTRGRIILFYVPDVVYIPDRHHALTGARLYIGDGAALVRSMVRKTSEGALFGHTPVRTQLTWCRKEGVPWAVITHCGSEIVRSPDSSEARLDELARERGVRAQLARDGLKLVLR